MSYLRDNWIWLSFVVGCCAVAAIITVGWVVGRAVLSVSGKDAPPKVAEWFQVVYVWAFTAFEVWYIWYLGARFQLAAPYIWAFLLGGLLALALSIYPLSKIRR